MSPLRIDCERYAPQGLRFSGKQERGPLNSHCGETRKTYRINFPSSEEIVLSPWVCFWSPHLVPLVQSRSGTWLFPLVQPSASLQASAEAKFPNPQDRLVTLANSCPHHYPLTLGSSLSQGSFCGDCRFGSRESVGVGALVLLLPQAKHTTSDRSMYLSGLRFPTCKMRTLD